MTQRWPSQTRYMLQPHTASIMKYLIDLLLISFLRNPSPVLPLRIALCLIVRFK